MRLGYARRALFLVCSLAAVPAWAQTRDQIREQNEQLYQQYQQGSADQGTAPPLGGGDVTGSSQAPDAGSPPAQGSGNLLAQLLDRVSRLEEQNRQLSGRVDELERNLATSTAQLNKQMGDLSFAMQQGHPGSAPGADMAPAGAPAPTPPPPVAAPSRPAPPARATRPTREAAAAPATPPPGPRGAPLAYRIAGTYSAEGNYRQAALAYYDVYNRQPHGPLAADALLHVGTSMMALGQNGAACEALAKMRAEFPNARPNVAHQVSALRARAHC